MPNIKSAIKRMKTSEKARVANSAVKSRIATARRKLYEAIAAGDKNACEQVYRSYCSMLDKGAKKGVIAKNAANRRKARAAARVSAMS